MAMILAEVARMVAADESMAIPRTPWWWVLIQGIAGIVLGFFLLTAPGATLTILVQFLGFYWFVTGILAIVMIFVDRTGWVWNLVVGILGILAGIVIIQHPLWSAVLVPAVAIIFLGAQGLVSGAIHLYQAFRGGGWGVGILGALGIIFGLYLLFNPLVGAAVLPWVLGIVGIVGGIAAVVMAFRLKRLG
jgi:uncharacterized membrane protein HdeD (DUF308 family)